MVRASARSAVTRWSPSATEERRVVTVLFADIVGYSSLSEHLDPERLKRLIDGAFQRLIVDIESFGGTIDKVLGDAIVALFGAPIAHEDDADRAIRAAMRLHVSLEEFVADQPDLTGPLHLRIGVNTGEVVVGTVAGTTEYTAMGDVVNVASRLQTMAPPGSVYIGDSTAALASDEIVRDLVDDIFVIGPRADRTGLERHRAAPSPADDRHPHRRPLRRSRQPARVARVGDVDGGERAQRRRGGHGRGRVRQDAARRARCCSAFPSRSAVRVRRRLRAVRREQRVGADRVGPVPTDGDRPVGPAERDPRRSAGARASSTTASKPTTRCSTCSSRPCCTCWAIRRRSIRWPRREPARRCSRWSSKALRRRSLHGPIMLWLDDLQWADQLVIDLLGRITRSLVDRSVLVITAHRDECDIDWPPATDHPDHGPHAARPAVARRVPRTRRCDPR